MKPMNKNKFWEIATIAIWVLSIIAGIAGLIFFW